MKNRLFGIGVLAALCGVSTMAGAQTCASPLPIQSNSTKNGNTCSAPTGTGSNSLSSYGGTPSPQNEIVYSFVAQSANATIAVTDPGSMGAAVFLMPSPCSTSTDPIQFGFAGTPMPVNTLTNGQTYYVIITADPAGPAGACGAYTLTVNGILPVSLQKFSVE